MTKNNKVRIVILDTGLDPSSSVAHHINFKGGLEFYLEDEEIVVKDNSIDDIGHGTAVASIIYKIVPECEIIPIKIVRNGIVNGTSILIASLRYIYKNITCNLINISAGVVCCEDITGLREICELLKNKGVIIVSAFDNGGAISYPAAFDCVIGIDGIRTNKRGKKFEKIKNSIVDYQGGHIEQRVPWLDGKRETVSGNSFLAPQFTAWIAQMLLKERLSFKEIKKKLDEMSYDVEECVSYSKQEIGFEINKAIVFPFNKEMHSIARYQDLLCCKIVGYYDVKYSGKIGKMIKELQNIELDVCIKDIMNLDWTEEFDTVILGHTTLLSEAIGIDLETYIIDKCNKHNKNIFSCRDIRDRKNLIQDINIYTPHIDPIPKQKIRKMHVIGKPVLGVVGTGSSQGKYTMQLALRRELLKQGYKVGQLGTEPTGLLFNMEAVYPVGHEGAVYMKGMDSVYAVNQIMGQIENENPDIILFGTQSQTVPFQAGGVQDYPIYQHEVLLGCQADAYILCVCNDAPIDYIKRTISYLEGLFPSQVIAIVISPLAITSRWSTITTLYLYISEDETKELKQLLSNTFSLPVVSMSDSGYINTLCQICIEHFS